MDLRVTLGLFPRSWYKKTNYGSSWVGQRVRFPMCLRPPTENKSQVNRENDHLPYIYSFNSSHLILKQRKLSSRSPVDTVDRAGKSISQWLIDKPWSSSIQNCDSIISLCPHLLSTNRSTSDKAEGLTSQSVVGEVTQTRLKVYTSVC